ncbi:outer membrane receptor protein involved in Fe transport [Chryseobacterium ginsenosidimutans]|uniref:TonB-dependent receptor n=1 Tax=Chryseobacterium ginsenosidimutans TaxID=687846 RepID=UPI002167FC39|nr:TonB-dependent receptor [Chryseobacterium ginsenosidimutans]MCS3869152.1 outer membrane receptor protein involved in Fe transport [Chryseobacterium ginsenosidimutans]
MNQTEIINIFTKKTLGLTFVLSAAAFAFAQDKVGISGSVVNKNNQPVPYASVTFSNKANKLFSDATLTDEKGQYKLDLAPGAYDITVEAIDYQKSVINKQITAAGNIGALSIEPEKSATNIKTGDIQGVVITAPSTKPYKVELDKRTYDPSQDIISKGGNLQDVLQNVPSVEVDTDGTVSMRGSSNVKFLINGKPSALLGISEGSNALQSIPADQIERIEVITNPSSKFEASGTSGILNIILKKSKKVGFNGSVVGTLGYQPKTMLNANLSWRKDKWTWFVNGGGGYNESTTTNRNSNMNYDRNEIFQLLRSDQETKNKNYSKNYNATAGFVYDIDDKNSINLSGTIRTFDNETDGKINYNYLYNFPPFPNPYTLRTSNGNNTNLAFQGDFGWDHKFDDKGQNLSVSLSLQSNKSDNATDIYQESDYLLQRDPTGNIVNILPQMTYTLSNNAQYSLTKSVIGKVDYELPLGENSKLEAGYRIDRNTNFYDNTANEADGLNIPFAPLNKFTNVTNYDELFNAFYAQFRSKIGKLGYQLGVRDELSNVKVDYRNLEGTTIDNNKNYNNLFPSVYLSYDLGKDNQFLLNYSRRIDRPRSWFLIPYFSITDNQNLFLGNVDLNPSYVDSFEFGYSISKKKFTLNPTLFYRKTTDDSKIVAYQEDERTNIYYTTPINLGTNEQYGLDFNGTADVFPWLKLMGSFSLFGYKTTGEYSYKTIDVKGNDIIRTQSYAGDGLSTRARLNATLKVDKTFSFQLQGFYRGAQNTASQDRKAMYALNLGASKTIWNGDGTISFNMQDIFNTRSMRSVNYLATGIRESYNQWQPRQFSVSLTYRFKQGEKVEQVKKKKDINSNATGDDQQGGPM